MITKIEIIIRNYENNKSIVDRITPFSVTLTPNNPIKSFNPNSKKDWINLKEQIINELDKIAEGEVRI